MKIRGRHVLIVDDHGGHGRDRNARGATTDVRGARSNREHPGGKLENAEVVMVNGDQDSRQIAPAPGSSDAAAQFDFVIGGNRVDASGKPCQGGDLVQPMVKVAILRALFPVATSESGDPRDDDIPTILPRLRLAAALLMDGTAAGDRLLELTLERAVAHAPLRNSDRSLERWLVELLDETHDRFGSTLLL